ncbi:diphosphocytidyl methyl erythritol synthase1 [Zea mays]|uniref:Diphosphocytidyl methyl erythritol synthase1 n=1 Tax=Zea mays TaxID=4577 RepID=A0A1D6N5A3_MAIZE|nr:diphosphocytidyl methyl erythritol synthase1 [Zea mays]
MIDWWLCVSCLKLLSVSIGSIKNLQLPLKFARPGKERQDSVFNGLQVSGKSIVCIAPYAPVHKYRRDPVCCLFAGN